MRRIALSVLALLVLAVAAAGITLLRAHLAIRRVRPPLPDVADVLATPPGELPSRVFAIETARQPLPRSGVLDPARDPVPDAAYAMTHPAFVLTWPDGRLFLFELGMDRASALGFGAPLQRFAGAGPIEPRGSVAERLGPAASRVRGIAVSHLHVDHTAGIAALCDALSGPLPLFQTPEQHDGGNYTTRGARAQLAEAGCARRVRVEAGGLAAIPGFPGLRLIAAAGHTPGSQMLVAHVRDGNGVEVWVFSGDVVNHRDAVAHDVPKPRLYSLLVVPEDMARLAQLRRFLAALAADPRVRLAVSHDADGIGMSEWPPMLPDVPAARGPDP